MKLKKACLALFLIVICSLSLRFALAQEMIYEHVDVINQEILVRVFSGNKPVPGLQAGDFTLSEDGKKVKINYCRELRRSLGSEPAPDAGSMTAQAEQRLFVFMLWFSEESREWPKAWDHFTSKIYRPGDRIILSDGSQALEVSSLEGDREAIAAFMKTSQEATKRKRISKARLVSELAGSAGDFYDGLVNGLIDPRMLLDDFKVRYRGALDEYRLARLKAHPRWLERLAGSLKAVEAEKWVLVFLQNERLPLLRRDGRLMSGAPARIKSDLERFMEESERQLRLGSDVIGYFRDLRPLFIGANATYHLFLSDAAGEILPDEHLGWQPVFSSWEGAFRQISVDTGGRVANTTRLAAALDAAASSEDVYYVLTYQPAEGQDRKRDIKIEMKRPGLRAVYSRKLTLGEIFPLKISAMEWQDGVLKIGLGDYQRLYGDEGLRGRLGISIRAEAKGREALVSTREIFPRDPLISVEMGLDLPAPGRYRLEVEVHDLWTGNKARAAKSIEISPPPAAEDGAGPEEAPELAALLDRAAEYCRKLKEGAFRFYCLEKVQEKVLQENPLQRVVQPLKRSWHYDYQIVGAGGQIKEQRRLVLDGTRKVDKANASLETRFAAHYSVFLPVTLLAVENRPLYHYRLAGSETLGKRACAVVEAAPRDPERGGISHGRIWIDEEDGSVLKVEMNPRGVAGSQALEEEARRMSAELILEATHWYLVAHEGLRFPSKIEFVETYRFDKGRQTRVRRDFDQNVAFPQPLLETTVRTVEFYRLSQEYEGYRFFAVQSREEIQPPQ